MKLLIPILTISAVCFLFGFRAPETARLTDQPPLYTLAEIEHKFGVDVSDGNYAPVVEATIRWMNKAAGDESYSADLMMEAVGEIARRLPEPARGVLHFVMADFYCTYWQNNRWRASDRTSAPDAGGSIDSWDMGRLLDEASKYYRLALSDKDALRQTPLGDYLNVLTFNNAIDDYWEQYFPTLYDALVFSTIQVHSGMMGIMYPNQRFTLDNAAYFADVRDFTRLEVAPPEQPSSEYETLRLYQELLAFRLAEYDQRPCAATAAPLLMLDVERLKYVHAEGTYPDPDTLYEAALRRITEQYSQYDTKAFASYELGRLYMKQGQMWERNSDNQTWRNGYVKAAEAARDAMQLKAIAPRAKEMFSEITSPLINLRVESDVYPGEPFLMLANCRNTPKLYIRIYPKRYESEFKYGDRRDLTPLESRGPAAEIDGIAFPDAGDHQYYSAQFPVAGLPQGHYIMVAAAVPFAEGWATDSLLHTCTAYFQVSPLACNIRDGNGEYFGLEGHQPSIKQFYVTDARSGRPVSNASVEIYDEDYDSPRDSRGRYPERLVKSYRTDSEGMAYVTPSRPPRFQLSRIIVTSPSGGRREIAEHSSFYSMNLKDEQSKPRAIFFTDRGLYRPGQTVWFKAIVIQRQEDGRNALVTDRPLEVILKDVNGGVASRLELRTNDYGSVEGSFTIPHGLLNGVMRLSCPYGEQQIRVEEYKRPTFEIRFDPVTRDYRYGEQIELTGRAAALAGYSVDNSRVVYRVTQQPSFRLFSLRRILPGIDRVDVCAGEVRTDAEGNFTISFPAAADGIANRDAICDYEVAVEITDPNGETRHHTTTVAVSDNPLLLVAELPSATARRDSLRFPLVLSTLNGHPVAADVSVRVKSLEGPGRTLRKWVWSERPDTTLMTRRDFERLFPNDTYGREDDPSTYPVRKEVASFSVAASDTPGSTMLDLSCLGDERAGWYRVTLRTSGPGGAVVEQVHNFRLNGAPNGRKAAPIATVDDWIIPLQKAVEPGGEAVFLVAAPERNSLVRYDLFAGGRTVRSGTLTAGPSPRRIVFEMGDECHGSATAQFITVHGGRTYTASHTIEVAEDTRLNIEFATFRDQLLPGEHERWTLTVTGPDGEPAMAEMVATLYDSSLDALHPLRWPGPDNFRSYSDRYRTPAWSADRRGRLARYELHNPQRFYNSTILMPRLGLSRFGAAYLNLTRNDGSRNILNSLQNIDPSLRADENAALGSDANRLPNVQIRGSAIADPHFVLESASDLDAVVVTGVLNRQAMSFTGAATMTETGGSTDTHFLTYEVFSDFDENFAFSDAVPPIEARRNFDETAFFRPQLRTDEQGRITIEFTIPESLTRWNMQGFAHTRDLLTGSISRSLITQKQVAVSANAPRFVREGDTLRFTAKVNNITADPLSGRVTLQVFDAQSMEPLEGIISSPATVTVGMGGGQSAVAGWDLTIPEGLQAVTYRLTARAGAHTDGEERTIPVMSNTILLTETMPFMVRAGESRKFDFSRLRQNAAQVKRNRTLTLEFTSNPAWYALQSMSYLMEYPYDCAEQLFSKFYANTLSAAICRRAPQAGRIFALWRELPESRDALLSSLEKNQELKQLILEETPWVMEAQNESDRKRRLGLLFDLDRMAGEQRMALDKLQDMQRGDGGFAWFDGLPPNRFITQHIVAGLGQLARMGTLDDKTSEQTGRMLARALKYLDDDLRRDYQRAKRVSAYPVYLPLHYLYAASFSAHKPSDETGREAFDYFYNSVRDHWREFNIYCQGLAALVLHRYGDTELAHQVVAALRQSSRTTEELGMFWRENRAGYFWYEAPIETQALMVSVFDEVADDPEAVEELKIWLLRNKQTNNWQTTKATTEACYALLATGSDLLDENRTPEVEIGDRELASAATEDISPEPGTGYVRTSWTGSEITPEMASLAVTNPNRHGAAWGGLYWQYMEQADRVTSAVTELGMDKRLYIKRNTPAGPELRAVTDTTRLKVGDRLTVRIILRADRPYEYVHLKDMRASSLEPEGQLSGYRCQDGLWYYQSMKDASANFFITSLPAGTYVFEYDLRVTHSGDFSNGVTTFQCMYAPEFSSHSEGLRIKVE